MQFDSQLASPASAVALPAVDVPRRLGRVLRLHPFEVVTLGSLLAAFAFLHFHGALRMDWSRALYLFQASVRLLPKTLLTGISMQILYRMLKRLPVKDYLRELARPRWWILWLRLSLALVLVNYGYFWLKVSIPLINPRLWDEALGRFDTWLHFGLSPTDLTVKLFAGTPLAVWMDAWYYLWLPGLFYTVAFWNTGMDARLRRRFVLSFVLLWILGSWTYMSMPALGPVFVTPRTFDGVIREMPNAEGLQELLWGNYQLMLEGRARGVAPQGINPTRGIACLPSLHVAVHAFFFFWAWRRARPLAKYFAIATCLTFAGSLLTGWHYAVDGYAGVLLAWICYRIGCWRDQADPVEDPAFPRQGL